MEEVVNSVSVPLETCWNLLEKQLIKVEIQLQSDTQRMKIGKKQDEEEEEEEEEDDDDDDEEEEKAHQ